MPAVSIIVPCYNYERFLSEALDSVLSQTFADWECIVVDDGSTDGSARVAAAYETNDSRIRLVCQENRGLPAAARNSGLRHCQGEYVFFLDADDAIHPEALCWLLNARADQTNCLRQMGFCMFQQRMQDAAASRLPPVRAQTLPDLLRGNFGPPHCYLARRDRVLEAGAFDEDLGVAGCEDWDLWLRLALRGAKLARVPQVGAYYRRHPFSLSTDAVKMVAAAIAVQLRGYKALSRGECQVAADDVSRYRAIAVRAMRVNLIGLGGSLFRLGHRGLAAEFVRLADAVARATGGTIVPGKALINSLYRRWRYPNVRTTPQVIQRAYQLRDQLRDVFAPDGK